MQETQETWVQSLSRENPLEKVTVTRSRNGDPLQYSCLRSPMDRRTQWATVHGVAKPLNNTKHTAHAHTHTHTHAQCVGRLLCAKEMTGGCGLLYSFRVDIGHQKDQDMIRGQELSTLPPCPQGRGEGWSRSQPPMANGFINHCYIMESPEIPKWQNSERFPVSGKSKCWEGGTPRKGTEAPFTPSSHTLLYGIFSIWLFPSSILYNKPICVSCSVLSLFHGL